MEILFLTEKLLEGCVRQKLCLVDQIGLVNVKDINALMAEAAMLIRDMWKVIEESESCFVETKGHIEQQRFKTVSSELSILMHEIDTNNPAKASIEFLNMERYMNDIDPDAYFKVAITPNGIDWKSFEVNQYLIMRLGAEIRSNLFLIDFCDSFRKEFFKT